MTIALVARAQFRQSPRPRCSVLRRVHARQKDKGRIAAIESRSGEYFLADSLVGAALLERAGGSRTARSTSSGSARPRYTRSAGAFAGRGREALEILVHDNGAIVRKGQPLFRVDPDEKMVSEDPAERRRRVRANTDAYLASVL